LEKKRVEERGQKSLGLIPKKVEREKLDLVHGGPSGKFGGADRRGSEIHGRNANAWGKGTRNWWVDAELKRGKTLRQRGKKINIVGGLVVRENQTVREAISIKTQKCNSQPKKTHRE